MQRCSKSTTARPTSRGRRTTSPSSGAFLIASAKSLTAYATGPLDGQYVKQRPDMLKQAIKMWEQIAGDQPDAAIGKEAKKRIGELEKKLGE